MTPVPFLLLLSQKIYLTFKGKPSKFSIILWNYLFILFIYLLNNYNYSLHSYIIGASESIQTKVSLSRIRELKAVMLYGVLPEKLHFV